MNILEIPQGAGSGTIWDANGHIVTNYHVIKGASELQVFRTPPPLLVCNATFWCVWEGVLCLAGGVSSLARPQGLHMYIHIMGCSVYG